MSEPIKLDATNLRCPLPIIKLAKLARDLPAGAIIDVRVSDPAAQYDIPAWARMKGHVAGGPKGFVPGSADFTMTVTLG